MGTRAVEWLEDGRTVAKIVRSETEEGIRQNDKWIKEWMRDMNKKSS